MDSLQEILYTLRQNKLRTLLTAFGVFWGIFMLILLLGAGRGMQNGVMNDFGSNVLDFIVVYPGTTAIAYKGLGLGRSIELNESDIQAIKQQVPGVGSISSTISMGSTLVTYEKKSGNFETIGVADEYFDIKAAIALNQGRKINSFDSEQVRKIAILGSVVAERLFAGENPVGKTVQIKGVALVVVGTFNDKEENGRAAERIYIPMSTYKKTFGGGQTIKNIWLRPAPGIDGFELQKNVVELVKRRHSVAPDDRRGVNSFNMAEPAKMVHGLFFGINTFIWFVGLGTLMAGIVGVSNIMIITVKERTREIGIRKALGATPFNIVGTLMIESIMVTAVAGYAGLVLGVGLLELVAFGLRAAGANLPFFQNPEVNFQVAFTAIVLLIVVGALAGLVPALKAARIMPIEAMRAD
ncbi:MAG TPA: ABC transporter permease [Cellvibrio sp.]|nr:ABC transporter permease [Cellvibrio sp.]